MLRKSSPDPIWASHTTRPFPAGRNQTAELMRNLIGKRGGLGGSGRSSVTLEKGHPRAAFSNIRRFEDMQAAVNKAYIQNIIVVCQLADRETCRNVFVVMRGRQHFGEPQLFLNGRPSSRMKELDLIGSK